MQLPPVTLSKFMPQQEDLFRAFAARADGHDRDAVIGACGNLILNTLRQNNRTLGDAYEELEALVSRMKVALAERHYTEDGRQNHHVVLGPDVVRVLRGMG